MVACTNRRPSAARKSALRLAAKILAALLVGLSSVSCQFIGMDMFPTTLSREDAVLDLDAKLADLGLSGEYEIRAMTFLKSPTTGKEYIFVTVSVVSGLPRLLILDASDLKLVKVIADDSMGELVITDMDDYFVTWNSTTSYRFDSGTFAFVDPFAPVFPSGYQAFTELGSSWILHYDSSLLYYQPFTSGWNPGTVDNNVLNSGIIPLLYLRNLYFEGGVVRLLFSGSDNSPGYIASFPDGTALIAAFSSVSIFEDSNATVVSIPSGDDNSGWLTRNGAIILTHDNDTRLVRYESDSGKELDSFSLNDTEDTRFAFSADGKQWLMYDGKRGKLHLLRTWW